MRIQQMIFFSNYLAPNVNRPMETGMELRTLLVTK